MVAAVASTASALANVVSSASIDINSLDLDLTTEDLIPGGCGREKFLDEYTITDLEALFQESGVRDALAQKGFTRQQIALDLKGIAVDKLRLYDLDVRQNSSIVLEEDMAVRTMAEPAVDNILPHHMVNDNFTRLPQTKRGQLKPPTGLPPLIEIAIRPKYDLKQSHAIEICRDILQSESTPHAELVSIKGTLKWLEQATESEVKFLMIEWVLMQDITQNLLATSELKRALPGQLYPGLGIMKQMSKTFLPRLASGKDVVLNNPLYFHNAVMYQPVPGTVFLNPEYEGKFQTLLADLDPLIRDRKEYGLAVMSRALFYGNVIHRPTGRRVVWDVMEQVVPMTPEGVAAFAGNDEFQTIVKAHTSAGLFEVDFDSKLTVDYRDSAVAISELEPLKLSQINTML